MTEMIERVARAIWEKRREMAAEDHIELEEWRDGSIPRANHVFEEAEVAIEAMREPTEAMLDYRDAFVKKHDARLVWQHQIDNALGKIK